MRIPSTISNRSLHWVTVIAPVSFVLGVILVTRLYWDFSFSWVEFSILLSSVGIAAAAFSTWVFRIIQQREDEIQRRASQLEALNQAAIALNTQLDLPVVLEKVVELARGLTDAEYGALGVLNESGTEFDQFITAGISDEAARQIGDPPKGHGVFSVLLNDGKPLRVARINEHERSIGFPRHHPPMDALIGVPIIAKGSVIGDLYVANKISTNGAQEGEFSDEDVQLVEMFSVQAALAIENARLYQQTQDLAVLEERERFGMDLHDGTIQSIYAVGLMLEDIRRRMGEEPDISQERIGEAVVSLNEVIADIRNYIMDLRPQQFGGRNIVEGIDEIARALRANTFMSVNVDVELDATLLDQETTIEVLHIIQEAISNVRKHARAREVKITAQRSEDRFHIQVIDDGVTISEEAIAEPDGNGLHNMRERAKALGGGLKIVPRDEGGTVVNLSFPADR
jgi:signal transduction histidine kinase